MTTSLRLELKAAFQLARGKSDMTPPPPARLCGFFARSAPICVIFRRGPSRHTQQILWRTDTDEFIPGQWIKKGVVHRAKISSDGKFMSIALMGVKSRIHTQADTQVSILCRPPYFSAIETNIGGLCYTPMPLLPEEKFDDTWTFQEGHVIDAMTGPAEAVDQNGRRVRFEKGCVLVWRDSKWQVIFDTNPLVFGPIAPPDWAIEPLNPNS